MSTHYCIYCEFYSRKPDGKRDPKMTVFTGTRDQVIEHAASHPIGDPDEMADELANYEGVTCTNCGKPDGPFTAEADVCDACVRELTGLNRL